MKKIISLIIAILFLGTSSLFAEIKVLKVKGTVAYKTGKDWTAVSAGMDLPEGVKISTGANSSAELKLNALNHTITIKPYTVIQVFSRTDSKNSDTNVGLKRGNIIVRVPKDKKVKTVFKVTTPIATSSVRGTAEDIFSGTKEMIVKVLDGEIEGSNRLGRKKNIRGRQVFHQKKGEPGSDNILSRLRKDSIPDFEDSDTSPLDNKTGEDAKVGVSIIWYLP
ncbi:MAG TPA: FecR family protein [Spirochaetota bacterium]|nr:FecR family protein [Spirochaetota bacterium]